LEHPRVPEPLTAGKGLDHAAKQLRLRLREVQVPLPRPRFSLVWHPRHFVQIPTTRGRRRAAIGSGYFWHSATRYALRPVS